MRANTEYQLYEPSSPQIQWYWKILHEMTDEEMGKFVLFVTGSSRVPLAGFAALQGMQGVSPITIVKERDPNRMPAAHTCMN